MNTKGFILTGQARCESAAEAIETIQAWLAEGDACRVFLNRQDEQVFVEMWKPETA